MNLVQLADVEITEALFLLQKIGRRDHDANADDIVIERNKPCPMELARIEDQRVSLVLVTRCALIADSDRSLVKKLRFVCRRSPDTSAR